MLFGFPRNRNALSVAMPREVAMFLAAPAASAGFSSDTTPRLRLIVSRSASAYSIARSSASRAIRS